MKETKSKPFLMNISKQVEDIYMRVGAQNPEKIRVAISQGLNLPEDEVMILGPNGSRVVILKDGLKTESIIISLDRGLSDHPIFASVPELSLDEFHDSAGYVHVSEGALEHISRPIVKLISLYHPENFPLPRFALAISDLAGAIRSQYRGRVLLADMQLDKTAEDIVEDTLREQPDILGVSVTFGQYDILDQIVSRVIDESTKLPLIVIGGSLAALNYQYLLEQYPQAIVARGFGESTMSDIITYWRTNGKLDAINDIAYTPFSESYKINNKNVYDNITVSCTTKRHDGLNLSILPELDLLEPTLEHGGVMQVEASRGCTFACSFCPREHKGRWLGNESDFLAETLKDIDEIYDRYPEIARKLFLVDEEFIGYRHDSVERAKSISDMFKRHRFRFESMARADQVYRGSKDSEWNVDRIEMWRHLVDSSLDRVLIGIESGVDSILTRFNKKVTAEQNAFAIRLLTSCGVPVRLTYITFDPLMNMDELIESYKFQGRVDLLLKPQPHLSSSELFEALHDEQFINSERMGKPMYTEIPYMLVSLECLLGSPYLRLVEESQLARDTNLLMGRRDANYLNPDIGLMSHFSQLWIDRSFSLDYSLKSLMKLKKKEGRKLLSELRETLKHQAYSLLGQMLSLVTGDFSLVPPHLPFSIEEFNELYTEWITLGNSPPAREKILSHLLDQNFASLVSTFEDRYNDFQSLLPASEQALISQIMSEWRTRTNWSLINDTYSQSTP